MCHRAGQRRGLGSSGFFFPPSLQKSVVSAGVTDPSFGATRGLPRLPNLGFGGNQLGYATGMDPRAAVPPRVRGRDCERGGSRARGTAAGAGQARISSTPLPPVCVPWRRSSCVKGLVGSWNPPSPATIPNRSEPQPAGRGRAGGGLAGSGAYLPLPEEQVAAVPSWAQASCMISRWLLFPARALWAAPAGPAPWPRSPTAYRVSCEVSAGPSRPVGPEEAACPQTKVPRLPSAPEDCAPPERPCIHSTSC